VRLLSFKRLPLLVYILYAAAGSDRLSVAAESPDCSASTVSSTVSDAEPIISCDRSFVDRLTDLDRWDDRQRRYANGLARSVARIDRFFGDEVVVDDNRQSSATLGIGLNYSQQGGAEFYTRVRVRFVMPRLQQRLQLILDDNIAVDEQDDEQAVIDAVKETRPDAGLRFILADWFRSRVSTDLGIRTSSPWQLYGRGRWRLTVPVDCWQWRLAETVAWFSEDGWQSSTEMQWSRPLSAFWLFRSTSRLLWEELSEGVTPSQMLDVTQPLSRRRAYRLYTSAVWPESPSVTVANYEIGVVYRQRIHSDWLFMEISPGFEFPQRRDYEINPVLGIKFEVVFSGD